MDPKQNGCDKIGPDSFPSSLKHAEYVERQRTIFLIGRAKEERERKQHWINACNSSGCEIQLFNQRYTIWLSNKDWKQAERDGDFLVRALESAARIGLPAKEPTMTKKRGEGKGV